MSDTLTVEENAPRDAALFKGDVESASILLRLYERDPIGQAALCGALAALSAAVLKAVDGIREELATVKGIAIPSARDVLSGVLLRLADPPEAG
jgi:hypothetical protein